MKKSTVIIASVALGIILVGGVSFFFLYRNGGSDTDPARILSNLFGNSSDTAVYPTPEEEAGGPGASIIDIDSAGQATQITSAPVAGATFVETGGSITIRYIEKLSGHVYEFTPATGEVHRLSNTTIAGVDRAHWTPDGESLVIKTSASEGGNLFFAEIDEEGISTSALPGAQAFTVSGNILITLEKDASGISAYLSSVNGADRSRIFSSPITEWAIERPQTATYLVPKPQLDLPGALYRVGAGSIQKILPDMRGFTARVFPESETILAGEGASNDLPITMYSLDGESPRQFPVRTLPEKCTGADEFIYCAVPKIIPEGAYPNAWYKGQISFSDYIWKVDPEIRTSEKMSDLDIAGGLDAIHLSVSPSAEYLLFINKKDSTLWALRLAE